MPEKKPDVYKTEEQIKQEALERRARETELAAAKPKSELEKKQENYWYHYKWHTIAGIFVLIMAVFFIKDVFFRIKPDVTIVAIMERYASEEAIQALTAAIEERATDYNGDKKVVVQIDVIALPSEEGDAVQAQQEMAGSMKLMAVVASAADPIYLLDEAGLDRMKAMNGDSEDPVFDPDIAPVSAMELGGGEFENTHILLRSYCPDEQYYEYCKNLILSLRQ